MEAAPCLHFEGNCGEACAYYGEPLRGRMINVAKAPQ